MSWKILCPQHNTKIELVQTMRFIVRERMISMLQLVIEDAPFVRDEIIQNFSGKAGLFLAARSKLAKPALTREAREMLDELTRLTIVGTPLQQDVMDRLSIDDIIGARKLLKEKAIPAQLNVVCQCDTMLEYDKNLADEMEIKAHKSHDNSVLILWLLGGAGGVISLLIAVLPTAA